MIYISKEDWNKISKDYKDVWTSDDIHGTKHNGKRTWMIGRNGVSTLLIEGIGFEIVDLDEDGNFIEECNECNGTGEVWHSDDGCDAPSEKRATCEECMGEAIINTEYNGI